MYVCEKPTKKHPEGRRGTNAGYRRHLYRKEAPCNECLEGARREDRQKRYEASPWRHPVEVEMECQKPTAKFPEGRRGTNAGFTAHKKVGETPCEECLQASREYQAAQTRKDYLKHKERKLKYQEEYRSKNKEKLRISDRIYYLNNKAKREAQKRVRELRFEEVPAEDFTAEEISDTHGTVCYLCETPIDLMEESGWTTSPQIDHVHPISHPDTPGHVLSNVKWTHARCNLSKNAKLLEELTLPFLPPVREKYGANEESEAFV